MTPSSKELSGIVLLHHSFGTHLNENGKTIDNVEVLDNFKKAGKLLFEIWSEMTTDGHQISVIKVDPSDESKVYHCFTDSKISVD